MWNHLRTYARPYCNSFFILSVLFAGSIGYWLEYTNNWDLLVAVWSFYGFSVIASVAVTVVVALVSKREPNIYAAFFTTSFASWGAVTLGVIVSDLMIGEGGQVSIFLSCLFSIAIVSSFFLSDALFVKHIGKSKRL